MISRLQNSALILVAFVVAGSIVPASSFAADAPTSIGERIFSFLDTNGDKSIDTKEFDTIPASMKIWLIERKFDGTAPISQAAFLAISERMMSDLRRGRSQVGVKPAQSAGAVSPKTTTGSTTADSATSNDNETVEVETTLPAGTASLPAEYQEGDINRDGQIDFFEWRKFKRSEMARFHQMDVNKDNVLSLAEITGEQASLSTSDTTTATTSSSPTTSPSTSPTSTKSSTPGGPSEGYIKKVKYYFTYMDMNKNKKLDADEWNASKRIKPVFEKAKIDLKKPMSETEFIAHYQKLFPEKGLEKSIEKSYKREEKQSRKDDRKDSRGGKDEQKDSKRRSSYRR